MEQIFPKLIVYGPLGIICAILCMACAVLYKAKERCQDEHRKEVAELVSQHREEMSALVTRHIAKAETWVEKGNELATNLNSVLDSLARRGK